MRRGVGRIHFLSMQSSSATAIEIYMPKIICYIVVLKVFKLGRGLFLRIADHGLPVCPRLDQYSWSRAHRLFLSSARA